VGDIQRQKPMRLPETLIQSAVFSRQSSKT
jgi:hypothetical protein